jgi:hypothetical protein
VGARTKKNGIAIFSISQKGKISSKPEEVFLFENYPRLENIHIVGNKCLLTDALNNTAYIFNLNDIIGSNKWEHIEEFIICRSIFEKG